MTIVVYVCWVCACVPLMINSHEKLDYHETNHFSPPPLPDLENAHNSENSLFREHFLWTLRLLEDEIAIIHMAHTVFIFHPLFSCIYRVDSRRVYRSTKNIENLIRLKPATIRILPIFVWMLHYSEKYCRYLMIVFSVAKAFCVDITMSIGSK